MIYTKQKLAEIFNVWAKRFAENPKEFSAMLDSTGIPIENYGDKCAEYFEKLATELTNEQVKEIALANGFKLKAQPNGEMDLNPYVYDFARVLLNVQSNK